MILDILAWVVVVIFATVVLFTAYKVVIAAIRGNVFAGTAVVLSIFALLICAFAWAIYHLGR